MDHHDEFTVLAVCAPEQAFAYVADLHHAPEWFPRPLAVGLVSGEDPLRIGTAYELRGALPGLRRGLHYEVIEVEPPYRITWATSAPRALHGCDAFTIEPEPRGCAVRFTSDFLLHGAAELRWRLGGGALLRRALLRSARNLAARLPAPSPALALA